MKNKLFAEAAIAMAVEDSAWQNIIFAELQLGELTERQLRGIEHLADLANDLKAQHEWRVQDRLSVGEAELLHDYEEETSDAMKD